MNLNEIVRGKSSKELRKIAEKLQWIADDLEGERPTYNLAIACGISDRSYQTVRNGYVNSYDGETIITMADGSKWKAIGHGPKGSPEKVTRNGYIEFIKI